MAEIEKDNPFEGWVMLLDAATIVKRDLKTVRKWVSEGKIRCYPVGRRLRLVNLEELRAYSNSRSRYPPRKSQMTRLKDKWDKEIWE